MFGDKLKELRIKKSPPKGLTQEEVANALGIPRGTYAHYELNKREPDTEMIVKLADFFAVSIDEMLSHKVNGGLYSALTQTEKKILENYRKLNAENKKEIDNLIDFKLYQQNKNDSAKATQNKAV